MPVFYFQETKPDTNDLFEKIKVYELSCTTNIAIKSPAVVTKSPVEDGTSIVDNYYLDNKTATFSGIITDIRVSGFDAENVPVFQWIGEISALRKSKKLLTLFADTEIIPNCVITTFDLDKSVDEGLSGWKCNLTFQEVDISERAKLVTIKQPKIEVKDDVNAKVNGGSSSTKAVGSTIATTTGFDAVNWIKDLF